MVTMVTVLRLNWQAINQSVSQSVSQHFVLGRYNIQHHRILTFLNTTSQSTVKQSCHLFCVCVCVLKHYVRCVSPPVFRSSACKLIGLRHLVLITHFNRTSCMLTQDVISYLTRFFWGVGGFCPHLDFNPLTLYRCCSLCTVGLTALYYAPSPL